MPNWKAWEPAAKLVGSCAAQWLAWLAAVKFGLGPSGAFALACSAGIWHLRPSPESEWTSKVFKAGLFPVSYCVLWLTFGLPSWIWAALAVVGMLVFPRLDAKSAPLWRSPSELSQGLAVLWLSNPGQIRNALDAGCGLGDAMLAMRSVFSGAKIIGFEAGFIPWAISRLRCGPGAIRGDFWIEPWSDFDFVYLFLRPEAMERAKQKAVIEMNPDAWVACMEFEFHGVLPEMESEIKPQRFLRLYKVSSLA